jgi:hypothetical protein
VSSGFRNLILDRFSIIRSHSTLRYALPEYKTTLLPASRQTLLATRFTATGQTSVDLGHRQRRVVFM